MLELPKPPWYRRVWMLNLAIAVVVVAVLVGATVALGSRTDQQANPPMVTGAATTEPARVEPTRPPTTLAPGTTDKAKSGVPREVSGGGEGPYDGLFEVPSGWSLAWSFNCPSFARYGGGNFKISGEGKLDDISVQRFAVKGSGSERVAVGGRGRLIIETVCDRWTVRATAP